MLSHEHRTAATAAPCGPRTSPQADAQAIPGQVEVLAQVAGKHICSPALKHGWLLVHTAATLLAMAAASSLLAVAPQRRVATEVVRHQYTAVVLHYLLHCSFVGVIWVEQYEL